MSHAQVDSATVIARCTEYLDNRNRNIKEVREKMISQLVGKKRLFRSPHTRETAIAELENDTWSEYNSAYSTGSYWAKKVQDLCILAQQSDTVFVDDEMTYLFKVKS